MNFTGTFSDPSSCHLCNAELNCGPKYWPSWISLDARQEIHSIRSVEHVNRFWRCPDMAYCIKPSRQWLYALSADCVQGQLLLHIEHAVWSRFSAAISISTLLLIWMIIFCQYFIVYKNLLRLCDKFCFMHHHSTIALSIDEYRNYRADNKFWLC